MDQVEIAARLREVAADLPAERQAKARADEARQRFQLETVSGLAPGGTIADIGGGLGFFVLGCAAIGMQPTLIDDFRDVISDHLVEDALGRCRSVGIKIESRDVIADGLGLPTESQDVIATFDSMEHWHDSPKALFAEVMSALKPGGWFVLGVPNSVNLRKRVAVPLGRAKWSQMSDWYEQPRFRGHVREPDVADLCYIAADMGLTEVTVVGRNWLGYKSPHALVRRVTPAFDRLLRCRPTLCSDLYLIGRKA